MSLAAQLSRLSCTLLVVILMLSSISCVESRQDFSNSSTLHNSKDGGRAIELHGATSTSKSKPNQLSTITADVGQGRSCPNCVSGECNTAAQISGLPIIQLIAAIIIGLVWAGIFIWLYASFYESGPAPAVGYGYGPSPSYGYGPSPMYGPPAPIYGPPPEPSYGPPPAPSYGPPPAPSYGPPPAPSYGPPPAPSYGPPPAPSYGPPPAPSYGPPPAPSYGPPPAPSYGSPPAPVYPAPVSGYSNAAPSSSYQSPDAVSDLATSLKAPSKRRISPHFGRSYEMFDMLDSNVKKAINSSQFH